MSTSATVPEPAPSSARSSVKRGILGTLNSRLSVALIMIVIAVGMCVMVASQAWMRIYYEELTQKLNASIAMYITGEYQLIQGDDGLPNVSVIQSLANQAMIINPIAEVYLLDVNGNIIAHALPPETSMQTFVPLEPIKQFLAGNAEYPIRASDPRHQGVNKIFSAAEIRYTEELRGYLYVVLGSEVYDNIEDGIQSSYSRTMALITITVITFAAAIIGVLIFSLLVRRLNTLSQKMHGFSELTLHGSLFDEKERDVPSPRDEIDLLTLTFEQMSSKIGRQLEMLSGADEVRRELISNVSHDLRTPLSTVQGYLETLLIKNDQLTETERLEYLNTAMKSSIRLGQLIGDLFELSKLESTHVVPNFEKFSLAELIYDTVQEFSLEMNAKSIHIDVRNDQNNAVVFADISLIQRVFENLIRNAVAYTPDNGEILFLIEEAEHSENNCIKVSIVDNGRGIKAEDLPFIFDRFYINPDRSREDTHSTGLGLAIVKRILDLHETSIQVQSTLNKGSRFAFALPRPITT
ncbi:ATP-binding protein [Neptunomonas sp.]|uniref:sensor histidine kinase n=1 Tax=Neptunomonas sp. TaxID=1971898 RepID=UPI0025FD9298|nr:ATP-binding protein [Neptunomonas sp.]